MCPCIQNFKLSNILLILFGDTSIHCENWERKAKDDIYHSQRQWWPWSGAEKGGLPGDFNGNNNFIFLKLEGRYPAALLFFIPYTHFIVTVL